eukprot:3775343-Rhodomonas_salina.4
MLLPGRECPGSDREKQGSISAMVLRIWYWMSGTDVPCDIATRSWERSYARSKESDLTRHPPSINENVHVQFFTF